MDRGCWGWFLGGCLFVSLRCVVLCWYCGIVGPEEEEEVRYSKVGKVAGNWAMAMTLVSSRLVSVSGAARCGNWNPSAVET